MDWCLPLDANVLAGHPLAGTEGELQLQAPAFGWSTIARYLLRDDGIDLRLTVWFAIAPGPVEVDVAIESTSSTRGAGRAYFRCPGLPGRPACEPRVGKLYWPLVGRPGFACRRCHDLAYRSSQERRHSFAELREQIFTRAANDGRWLAPVPRAG